VECACALYASLPFSGIALCVCECYVTFICRNKVLSGKKAITVEAANGEKYFHGKIFADNML
jgi:hypothetical protein